jgi:pilus assembly protein TadC
LQLIITVVLLTAYSEFVLQVFWECNMVERRRERFPIGILVLGLASTVFWLFVFRNLGYSFRDVLAVGAFGVVVLFLAVTLAWRKRNRDAAAR